MGVADYPSFRLDGRAVLVTGASRGIGRDLACALAQAGASVAAAGRSVDDLHSLVKEIAAKGGTAVAVGLDVRDRASVDAAVAATVEHLGRIDVLVNNAGVGTNHDAFDATEEEWDDVLDVNLKGLDPAFLADVLARIPLGRVGTPMDVAGAVIFLASPAADLVTGAVLPVDGGWTVQ